MSAPPYMRFYFGDYLADTMHLTPLEHGCYVLLIIAYWHNEGPLPADDKKLARLVKMNSKEWSKVRDTLSEFFAIEGNCWRHNRIERELAAVREKSDKARTSVRTRYERTTNVDQDSTTNVDQTKHERTTDDLPVQSSEFRVQRSDSEPPQPPQGAERARKAKPCLEPPDFGLFWQAYPRRVARGDAIKAFAKVPEALHGGIVEHLLKRRTADPAWLKDGGQFIPYPATWLNQLGWQDEYLPAQPPSSDPFAELHAWNEAHPIPNGADHG